MKKLAIIVVLLTTFAFSAKAQMFDFEQNSEDFCIGINGGVVGYEFNGKQVNKNISAFGIGASLSMVGIYVDFIYQPPQHGMGTRIEPKIYDDHTALTINAGYKIPVTEWLNLIPLVGYSNETYGETDCTTNSSTLDKRSLFHKYTTLARDNHFNYGVGLSLKPFEFLEFGAVCTAHAFYGNLSFNLFGLNN